MPNDLRVLWSQARRHCLGALSLAVLIWAGAGLSGCATHQAVNFHQNGVETFAVAPHFSIKWRRGIDAPPNWTLKQREFSTPLYRGETDEVYVGSDAGNLFKMRGGNGQLLWAAKLGAPVHASAAYGGGLVYVGTLGGVFYALDDTTGEVAWQVDGDASIETAAVYAEGRVFFTTSKDVLSALDAQTGKVLWTYKRSTPEYFTLKGSGQPVVQDGVVYCGFADGVLAAVQLDSGEMLWESDLSGDKTEFVDVDGKVAVSGSRVFAASFDGGVYAVDRHSGEQLWKTPIKGVADLVYGERTLYVATAGGRVIALSSEDGSAIWSYKFEAHSPVAISATQLYLFVSTAQGPLYTLDRMSGFPFVTWNPSNGFSTPLVPSQNGGFAYSNRGFLYHLDIAF